MSVIRESKYYVSDCLAERYPYIAYNGFAGQPSRDAGHVFDGYGDSGLDNLLRSLTDHSIDDVERAKAVHHLVARSACQETKMVLLHRGVTALLVSLLCRHPCATLQHQCFLLLRSLCVTCQGCHCALHDDAVSAAVAALDSPIPSREYAETRIAAAEFLCQVTSNVGGRAWLLGLQKYDAMKLTEGDSASCAVEEGGAEADTENDAGCAATSRVKAESLVGCLTRLLQTEEAESLVALYALRALNALTAVAPGVGLCITAATTISVLTTHLRRFATPTAVTPLSSPAITFLTELLSVLWNVAMDQRGVELLESCGAVEGLFDLFACVVQTTTLPDTTYPTSLQRQMMGALSAVFKLTSVKLASISMAFAGYESRVHALLDYLRWINGTVDEVRRSGGEVDGSVVALSKNTVQCLRLASEVRTVRNATHRLLDELVAQGATTEAFYLRRQLYYGTRWEDEYDAHV